MFETGFGELVLLFVIGLLVLGPQRLPKVAAEIVKWVGRARRTATQLRRQLEREIELSEIEPPKPPPKPQAPPPDASAPPETAPASEQPPEAAPSSEQAPAAEAAAGHASPPEVAPEAVEQVGAEEPRDRSAAS